MHLARLAALALLVPPLAAGASAQTGSALGTSVPQVAPRPPAHPKGAPKTTPVVQARPDSHAQKPSNPKAAAKPAAGRAASAPPPAPVAAPSPSETAPAPGSAPAASSAAAKGTVTGLALPRWASLRADDVNLRAGPSMNNQIDWVYHRRDLPVQIEREFEVWRLVEDQDGVKGWVHQATLTARRGFVVTGAERTLRASANDTAAPVARLKPGVVGRIRSCEANSPWCEVQVQDYRGYLKRDEFYGTYPGEAVGG